MSIFFWIVVAIVAAWVNLIVVLVVVDRRRTAMKSRETIAGKLAREINDEIRARYGEGDLDDLS